MRIVLESSPVQYFKYMKYAVQHWFKEEINMKTLSFSSEDPMQELLKMCCENLEQFGVLMQNLTIKPIVKCLKECDEEFLENLSLCKTY